MKKNDATEKSKNSKPDSMFDIKRAILLLLEINNFVTALVAVGGFILTLYFLFFGMAVETTTPKMISIIASIILPMFILVCYIFIAKNAKDIFKTIADRKPFNRENTRRIREIGLAVILIPLISLLLNLSGSNIERSGIIPGFLFSIQPNAGSILTGIVIFIIAEVFDHGTKLREENELTV